MIKRRLFASGLVAAPFVNPAFAQAWQPSGPIKMVVAYPAGGPTDAIARIVAADISGPLGQQVVVENVSGASGAIGTRAVAKAKPDGLTITFGNNQTHGNNMFMLKEPGYDAIKDFAPLAGAGARRRDEAVAGLPGHLQLGELLLRLGDARAVALVAAGQGPGLFRRRRTHALAVDVGDERDVAKRDTPDRAHGPSRGRRGAALRRAV